MAITIIIVYAIGIVWLMTNAGLNFTECPTDDDGIVEYNKKLYTLLWKINNSYDNFFIDWSDYDGCNNVSITLDLSTEFPVNLKPTYSNTYSNCINNGTYYEIKSTYILGILQVTIGSCSLLPIYLLNEGKHRRKGIYDLLIFIANPNDEGWKYLSNIETQSSKWNSFSLNQYKNITSSEDIKSSHYNLTQYKSYCFHLYKDRWINDNDDNDDDWFFVSPKLIQNLHYLFLQPNVELDSIDYNNHITGNQFVKDKGFHLNGKIYTFFIFMYKIKKQFIAKLTK